MFEQVLDMVVAQGQTDHSLCLCIAFLPFGKFGRPTRRSRGQDVVLQLAERKYELQFLLSDMEARLDSVNFSSFRF